MQRCLLEKKLVNFLIVGSQKSGTSALDNYLRLHPMINMARRKECHFFDRDIHFGEEVDYNNYHRLFNDLNSELISGESTPVYMYWQPSMQRIFEYNPKMKLIAVLRNPINRAYSAWNMEVNRGIEDLSFAQAIRTESQRCEAVLPHQHRNFSYIDRGFYSKQIQRMWKFFPKEQTLFIKYDDLIKDLNGTALMITDFLGVSPFVDLKYESVNTTKYSKKIHPEDLRFLKRLFQPEICQLESILGWDCQSWLQ